MCLAVACKKDKKTPETPPPTPEPDFTLQQSDVNYPVGTTWVYSISSQTLSQDVINNTPPYVEMISNSTYTLKVMYDSLMASGTTGKVLQNFFTNNTGITFKELQYVNTTNNLWTQILFGNVGTNSVTPSAFTIKLPLSTSTNWKNPYFPTQSNIDTCYTLGGFENLQLSAGYLKCINFKAQGYDGNYSYNNNYWYNKSRGLAQAIGKKYYYPSNNTLKTYASTLTLTKFN